MVSCPYALAKCVLIVHMSRMVISGLAGVSLTDYIIVCSPPHPDNLLIKMASRQLTVNRTKLIFLVVEVETTIGNQAPVSARSNEISIRNQLPGRPCCC